MKFFFLKFSIGVNGRIKIKIKIKGGTVLRKSNRKERKGEIEIFV